jgi:hypothetical protein
VRFWDSSAAVTLFVQQEHSATVRELYAADDQVLAWTLTDVEIRSGLARLLRERAIADKDFQDASQRAEWFWKGVHVVSLVDPVKTRAKRLLGIHSLTAADALQLGAALAATSDDPTTLGFVCLDERLRLAAMREGFSVLPS